MLLSGKAIRFTAKEIESNRKIGLDLQGVKSADDFGNAIIPWIDALGEVRPDLLDRLAQELAKAKGARLPARLSVVPSSDSAD